MEDLKARGQKIIDDLRLQVLRFDNDYRLAKTAGIGQTTVQRFAAGRTPSVETIFVLMAFFNATVKYKGAPIKGGRNMNVGRRTVKVPKK